MEIVLILYSQQSYNFMLNFIVTVPLAKAVIVLN